MRGDRRTDVTKLVLAFHMFCTEELLGLQRSVLRVESNMVFEE